MRNSLFSRRAGVFGGQTARPSQLSPGSLFTWIAVGLLLAAPATAPAQQPQDLGNIVINVPAAITIHLTGSSPELENLAGVAFESNARYQRVTGGAQFEVRFSTVAANQVRADVSKGGASVFSQVATGSSNNNALLRAADLVVKATSGLNGYFASQLAFVSNHSAKQDIYTSDLFFSEVKQVTTTGAAVLRPRWSPDGNKLIYTSYAHNAPDIYVLDLPSRNVSTFVSLKGSNLSARYSPDGHQVVMVLTGTGQSEIYVGDSQGRGITPRTHSDLVKSAPAWSPDGSKIIFSSDPGPQLMVMPAAGGTPTRVATGGISNYCAEPDWSRGDPNKIVFTVRSGSAYQVAVCDLSGKTPAKIVSKKVPAADVLEAGWLADGRHIVCTARMPNQRVLYLVDTETGKATRLSPPSLGECEAASVLAP